jgi:hypothetical protein
MSKLSSSHDFKEMYCREFQETLDGEFFSVVW